MYEGGLVKFTVSRQFSALIIALGLQATVDRALAYGKLVGGTQQIVLIGLNVGVKTGSIVFQLVLQQYVAKQVARFCCLFYKVPEAVQDYFNTDQVQVYLFTLIQLQYNNNKKKKE